MKLSPALDFHVLDDWDDIQLEYVSEGGVCKQWLLWWARPGAKRRATAVYGPVLAQSEPESESIEADQADVAPLGQVGQWLIEPDPAVRLGKRLDRQ